MRVVDYLIARDGLPPRSGRAYDFVVAGDGLYVVTDNDLLSVRVPVASCSIRGLPPIYPAWELRHGRLPRTLWDQIVVLGRAFAAHDREVLCAVTFDPAYGYRLAIPRQLVRRDNVYYHPPAGTVLEVHSHHRYPAAFSPTDDADEQRLCLYGVIGRLDAPRPEVALRVGAYGYRLPIPWEAVFEGERADFRDVGFESDDEVGTSDDLSN